MVCGAHSVAESYRKDFLSLSIRIMSRGTGRNNLIIAYRYLAQRGGKEYYEMIRMAGVRHAEDRDDHIVHAVGLGLTVIDEEMRDTMAKNQALAEALDSAEQANKAKTAFLSSMSHEIRTPMNAIIGLDSLALRNGNYPGRDEGVSGEDRRQRPASAGTDQRYPGYEPDRIRTAHDPQRKNSPSAACWNRSIPWSCPSAVKRVSTMSAGSSAVSATTISAMI